MYINCMYLNIHGEYVISEVMFRRLGVPLNFIVLTNSFLRMSRMLTTPFSPPTASPHMIGRPTNAIFAPEEEKNSVN